MASSRTWIIFLLSALVLPLLLQTFAPALLGRAILIGIFTILVIGFDLAVGYGGQINLGFQGFFAVGAYTTALLTARKGLPPLLSEPLIAMVVGCLVSVTICYLISRPVLRTGGFFLAMVTLAFGMVIYTLANGWDFLGGASGIIGVPRFHIGPLLFRNDLWYCYAVWAFTLLSIFFSLRMVNSRWGIALRALHGDEIAAGITGVNTSKYKMEVFLVSAIYASIAGSLFAHHLRGVNPPMFTFTLLLVVTLAIFFGGIGTIWGGLVGAALVQVLPESVTLLTGYWPWMSQTRELLYGLIFVLIILFMPEGVFGKAKKSLHGSRGRPHRSFRGHLIAFNQLMDRSPQLKDANEILLEGRNLTKTFGGLVALSDLSFILRKRQILAIIGPNGAGKTTCLNLVSGILRPTSGEIRFKGAVITGLSPYERAYCGIGRTFQNIRLFSSGMTVVENVIAGRHTRTKVGLPTVFFRWKQSNREFAQAAEEALKWLDFVGLLHKSNLDVGELTFAEQRSLELARALAGEPELLLLDELAAGLNEAEAEHAANRILQIRDHLNMTICLVEHNMNLVMSTADRILVLNYGQKLAEGTPAEIQSNEEVIRAYLGSKEP